MDKTIERVLHGQWENHLLPFFWVHGEEEAVLRDYIRAMYDADCKAFCVESRPHPDFLGDRWWHDMDIILDEAQARGMRVWILDDKHFPTGYAAGALENADPSLCRQSVFCHMLDFDGDDTLVTFDYDSLKHPPEYKMSPFEQYFMGTGHRVFDDDQVYSITAYGPEKQVVDLTGRREWRKPEGAWQVVVCGLSRNLGPHRNYINMMDRESVSYLLNAVYEPHYAHYGHLFGSTIAGFFSDEPELGNGIIYRMHSKLGTDQDLPWSRELEARLGPDFRSKLPLLWKNDWDALETARVRCAYMDAVTDLVSQDFSYQLGDWCRAHGVEYIGHMIEDNDTSTCTGSGLGHYFRGLAGQDMSGIDDIGGAVIPQGEEYPKETGAGFRNGGFYHYVLAKLGVSGATIDPKKKGRAMCEIFGAYGWNSGVYDMKYLADHFLVRGVNYYVPHAFSAKAYPDPDCPPHFYAHGNHPQYRHFGELCRYMNRVSHLITGGKICAKVAILYNAESEWAGEAMLLDKPAKVLMENQIDFVILPYDSIGLAENYDTLVVPYGRYWPEELAQVPNAVFIDALPDNISSGRTVPLSGLAAYLLGRGTNTVSLAPGSPWVRCLHYQAGYELFMLVNEGTTAYTGTVTLPATGRCCFFNAWENRLERASVRQDRGMARIRCELLPRKSLIVLFDPTLQDGDLTDPLDTVGERRELLVWDRSLCRGRAYPAFGNSKQVTLPDNVEEEAPDFSGYVRYERDIEIDSADMPSCLEITDAAEGVEVFINGKSLGIQIVPPFYYDLKGILQTGANHLTVEIATTLAREVMSFGGPAAQRMSVAGVRSGITGTVKLICPARSGGRTVK